MVQTNQRCVAGSNEMNVSSAGAWAIVVFALSGVWICCLCFVILMMRSSIRVHPEDGVVPEKGRCSAAMVRYGETVLGALVFLVTGAGLVVLGITQLPKDKPFCALEAYSVSELKRWFDEPVHRMGAVWCDPGAWASTCFGSLAYCNHGLVCSMLLNKIVKYNGEARIRKHKQKLQAARDRALSSERHSHHAPGPHIPKHAAKEKEVPLPMHEDLDGRVFDV